MLAELILSAARLRAVWPALALAPGTARAGHTTPLRDDSPDRLVYLTRRHELDRHARFLAVQAGRTPGLPHPGEPDSRLLDARDRVDRAVSDVAPQAWRAAFGQPLHTAAADVPTRVQLGLDAIVHAAATLTYGPLGAALAGQLDQAADRAERVAGLAAFWKPLYGLDCPGCHLPLLRVRVDSPVSAEWVIECRYRQCVCGGYGCPCGRTDRVKGRRHLWAVGEWPGLCDVLGTTSGQRLRDMLSCLA